MPKKTKRTGLWDLFDGEPPPVSSPAAEPLEAFSPVDRAAGGDLSEDMSETRLIKKPSAAPAKPAEAGVHPRRMAQLPTNVQAWLIVEGGGECFPIKKSLTIIGRVREVADIVIADERLSRHHAALTYEEGRFFVEDLDSTNGTFVRGKRIKRSELKPGDIVKVGLCEMRLVIE